jgi:hypothetical protein
MGKIADAIGARFDFIDVGEGANRVAVGNPETPAHSALARDTKSRTTCS